MAYICDDCGHIFEEGEQKRRKESRGEFWGSKSYEYVSVCPICGGSYSEAEVCEICGSAHTEEDLHGGVCDECIDKYRYNPDVLYKVGENDTANVEINSFLATIFTAQEINEILHREMKTIAKYAMVSGNDFIDSDVDWFGEMLAKEVNNNEKGKKQS